MDSKKLKILAVDDSFTIRKILELILGKSGYEVELAATASECLEKVQDFQPGLILLDYVLPDMECQDLCDRLAEVPSARNTPILMISSNGSAIQQVYQTCVNVKDYLTKPFQAKLLTSVVDRLSTSGRKVANTSRQVLVVDDSLTVRKFMEMSLKREGFKVKGVGSGKECLAGAKDFNPDLILLDYILPDMESDDIIAGLQADNKTRHIPILMVSSNEDAIRQIYQSYGNVKDYLTKPYEAKLLSSVVKKFVNTRELEEGRKPRVLCVDDSFTIRKFTEVALGKKGFDVQVAESGEECLQVVEAFKPDLILLDFILPDLSSTEVCERLLEIPVTKDVPVLMISSNGFAIQRMYENFPNVKDYLTKPFQANVLTSVIGETVESEPR